MGKDTASFPDPLPTLQSDRKSEVILQSDICLLRAEYRLVRGETYMEGLECGSTSPTPASTVQIKAITSLESSCAKLTCSYTDGTLTILHG